MCPGSPLGCCASTFVDSRCKKGKPCHYPSPIPCYNNVAHTIQSTIARGFQCRMSWWLSKQTKIHAQAKTNKGWWAANLSAVYICIYIYVQFWEWEIMERGSTAATVIASRNSLTLSLVPKKHFCMCQQKILLLPDPGGYLGQRRTPGTSRNSFASQAPKKCGFGSKHKDTKVFCSSGACGSSNAMEPVGIQLGMGWGSICTQNAGIAKRLTLNNLFWMTVHWPSRPKDDLRLVWQKVAQRVEELPLPNFHTRQNKIAVSQFLQFLAIPRNFHQKLTVRQNGVSNWTAAFPRLGMTVLAFSFHLNLYGDHLTFIFM